LEWLLCLSKRHAGQQLLVALGLLPSCAFLCMRCVVGLHLYLSTACRKLRHSTCAFRMYWEVACDLRMILILWMCLSSRHPLCLGDTAWLIKRAAASYPHTWLMTGRAQWCGFGYADECHEQVLSSLRKPQRNAAAAPNSQSTASCGLGFGSCTPCIIQS
jgi:hypothetical protein